MTTINCARYAEREKDLPLEEFIKNRVKNSSVGTNNRLQGYIRQKMGELERFTAEQQQEFKNIAKEDRYWELDAYEMSEVSKINFDIMIEFYRRYIDAIQSGTGIDAYWLEMALEIEK